MVLVTIAELFKKYTDQAGFAARWGGEEFLLVYHEEKERAFAELENFLAELLNMTFTYEDDSFGVTMTFGFTEYEVGESIDMLIKRADDLLYQGKAEGRNRIKNT